MKTIKWSNEEILKDFSQLENLHELIHQLEVKYNETGHLVCEIRINGMLLEEDDEVRFADTPVKEIRELSISIGPLTELVNDVQNAFNECIPSLQETALRAADFYREGELQKAQNVFSALLEGCQWLVETLVHTRRASIRHATGDFVNSRWAEAEKEFSKTVRQVLVAFEKRDYNLMADLLEYELTNLLDSWLNLLKESSSKTSSVVEMADENSMEAQVINDRGDELQNSLG